MLDNKFSPNFLIKVMRIMEKKFLTAEWKNLIMANYVVDSSILASYVPNGTELDSWEGKTFISMVGFMFLNSSNSRLRKEKRPITEMKAPTRKAISRLSSVLISPVSKKKN